MQRQLVYLTALCLHSTVLLQLQQLKRQLMQQLVLGLMRQAC
jgi:hypothetical protein